VPSLDKSDYKIIALLATGYDNKQISGELNVPLSTIQRRTRNIINRGIVSNNFQPDFKKLGVHRGLLHIYLKDGDIKEMAKEISQMDGVLSASGHIGNSDIVSDFVYEDNDELVDTISALKHMDDVDHVLWSEEVFKVPLDSANILRTYKRMWNNGNNKKW
jgi:DNA-binding Lrp family transcriptional regulator